MSSAMPCPAPELLAEAVTALDEAVLAHAAGCATCQALLDDQRLVHGLLTALPDQTLDRAHRESLAAEVMARADALTGARAGAPQALRVQSHVRAEADAHRELDESGGVRGAGNLRADRGGERAVRPRRVRAIAMLAGAGLCAAALAFVLLRPVHETSEAPVAITPPPLPALPTTSRRVDVRPDPVPTTPAPAPARPSVPVVVSAKIDGAGEYSRDVGGDRDVVTLARGDVTVDSIGARPIAVVRGDTSVVAASAKAQVVAKRGVIAQVTVIAGSVEVTVAGKRVVIEQGMTWDRNASREDSLAAFRTGWEALRAGDNAAAIAAFDRATDEVVAEDALYWGAIASERVNDATGAITRYRALVETFPKSPRVLAAEAAILRLSP